MSRVPEVLMCRLFGLHGGAQPVAATFWLLEAPDSLAVQGRRDPDGTGLGWYDDGRSQVERSPIAAYEDRRCAEEARHVTSRTFVAYVRFASTGGLCVENTHPFEQDGRLLAHNGVVGDLPQLDARLTKLGTRGLVQGDTDSERVFALVTGETRRTGGGLAAGLTAAVHWVAATLPLYALNLVTVSRDELWALCYPDTHDLLVLARSAGGRYLDAASAPGSIRVRSGDLAATPAVLVASQRLDEDPGWHPLNTGELLHVGPDLVPTCSLGSPPSRHTARTPTHPRRTRRAGGPQPAANPSPLPDGAVRNSQWMLSIGTRAAARQSRKPTRLPGYPPTTGPDSPD